MNIFPLWEFGAREKCVVVGDRRLDMENVGHMNVARCGQPKVFDRGKEVQAVLGVPTAVGKGA